MHCISILTIEYPGCLNLTSAEERSNVYARLSASLSVWLSAGKELLNSQRVVTDCRESFQ